MRKNVGDHFGGSHRFQIIIREMKAADRDAVISIHRQSIFGICKDHYTVHEMKAWTDRLTPELFDEGVRDENNAGVVAIVEGVLIGYGFFNSDAQELRAVYVLPEYAGRGAGGVLLARLEDMARERKIERLSLQSTITAVGFYEKSGYRKGEPAKHRINVEVSISCVRMEKDL